MGPNVKFVSAITDAFSNKKMGVNFFPEKRPNPGGGGWGSEGGLVKDHTFPLFLLTPSLSNNRESICVLFVFAFGGMEAWMLIPIKQYKMLITESQFVFGLCLYLVVWKHVCLHLYNSIKC